MRQYYRLAPSVRYVRAARCCIILNVNTGRFLRGTEVSGEVLDQLRQGASLAMMIETVSARYAVPPHKVARDIDLILQEYVALEIAKPTSRPDVGSRTLVDE